MKSVAAHDRPREKLQRVGATALGDNELLAVVFGHGRANASALDLANAVLTAVAGSIGSRGPGTTSFVAFRGLAPPGRRRSWRPSNWGAGR